ncbi:hypothetical protein Gasu2_17550 [Galdieria sulphuraria]|nr:hypothetical protein Gasu2_17550 [Galdieria sulphuraria]
MPKSCLCHRKWELTGYFVILGTLVVRLSKSKQYNSFVISATGKTPDQPLVFYLFQTWKQSIAVKFAFDFSTFVSSTFFISGVAIFGAVGLHRSRDELVASREKLSCSNLTELEEEHELPSISDYRFDDPSSTRSIRKTSKL